MIWRILAAGLASFAFAVLFGVKGKNILLSGLNGALSYLAFSLCALSSPLLGFFAGGITMALFSEVFARVCKKPATLFLVPGLIPLVPGATLFNSILTALEHNPSGAVTLFYQMLLETGAIALGIILLSSFMKLGPPFKQIVLRKHTKP